jgi:hypothetical protein
MFNQALTALGSFFARAFWLGTFAPVTSIAFVHLLVASQVFPKQIKLAEWITEDPLEKVTVSALAIIGLILLSYAISPFTPLLRGYLDGTRLPAFVRGPMRRARYQIAHRARRRIAKLANDRAALQALNTEIKLALEAASADKPATDTAPADLSIERPAPSEPQNDQIAASMAGLQAVLSTARVPAKEDLQAMGAALSALLNAHSATRKDAQAERLNGLWLEFVDLLDASIALAGADFAAEMKRSRLAWALPASEATAVGDTRQLAERYSENMYGVAFSYLWPRLRVKLGDTAVEDKALDGAQTQIEFAVLALSLSLSVPLVWIPLIGLYGTSMPLLVGVTVFGPVAWIFFYQLVVQSQSAFGGVVQALIDTKRLQVLTDMSLPCPATAGEERELWEMLQAGDQGAAPSLRYVHREETATS